MYKSIHTQVATLRLLVGFLGEQSQFSWWPSAFFAPSSSAFLLPIFRKTGFIAQYKGVKEAASRVHDEHIGVGKVSHLFRLPENIEQVLFNSLQDDIFSGSLRDQLQHQDRALESLITLADAHQECAEGPVLVGDIDGFMEGKNLQLLAHYYLSAFTRNTRIYPYYLDKK